MKKKNFLLFIISLTILVNCNFGETESPLLKITLLNNVEEGWHETELNYNIQIISELPPYRLVVVAEEEGLNKTGSLDTILESNSFNYKYIIDNSQNNERKMQLKFYVYQSDNKCDSMTREIMVHRIDNRPAYTESFNLKLYPINLALENQDCFLSIDQIFTNTEAANNSDEIIFGYFWSDTTGCLIASPSSVFLQSIPNGSGNWSYKNTYRFMYLIQNYFDDIDGTDNFEALQNLNFDNSTCFDTLKNIQINDEIALNLNDSAVNGLIKIEDFNSTDKSLTFSILLCIIGD